MITPATPLNYAHPGGLLDYVLGPRSTEMKILDRLLSCIVEDDEVEASKILLGFGMKWFVFGSVVGIAIGILLETL